MEQVARYDHQADWKGLSVVLMDDKGIALLNRQYLGRSGATDVLSFRYPAWLGTKECVSGEVAVSVERAVTEGPRRGSASSELALYLAHGCNHLTGEDDSTEKARKRMRNRELRWLKQIREELDLSGLLRI